MKKLGHLVAFKTMITTFFIVGYVFTIRHLFMIGLVFFIPLSFFYEGFLASKNKNFLLPLLFSLVWFFIFIDLLITYKSIFYILYYTLCYAFGYLTGRNKYKKIG